MNRTNFEHAGYALLMMLPFVLFGQALAGAAFSIAFFIGRELTQAEYRYIQANGGNRYETPKNPAIGSLNPAYWTLDSILDFVAPAGACILAYAAARWVGI
jgi:hypothetical protein